MGQTNDKKAVVRSRAAKTQQAARFDSTRFVQYELDLAEQAQCKAWSFSFEDFEGQLFALVDDGYSVSFKYDGYSSSYAVFVQVRGDPDHINAGLVLAGRGSTPIKAFKQVCFKMGAIGPSWVSYAERPKSVIDD